MAETQMFDSMDRPIVFMYSGQGSQTYQMGRELFHKNAIFKQWMHEADRLVQQWLSVSLLDELYADKHSVATPFTRTLLTHPAIFAVQYAMSQVLKSLDIHPDLLLGASLGEFSAAAVAEAISFDQAMNLICLQAQILETHCPNSGGMLAVLAPISLHQSLPLLSDITTLAAVNTPEHFVLAGKRPKLRAVEGLLTEQGITSLLLPVTHGFHSPVIDSVAGIYRPVLKRHTYRPPNTPLQFCSTAGPVEAVTAEVFWRTIRSPILFQETLQKLESSGPNIYLDVGPSGTLATFAKHNLQPDSDSLAITSLTPFGEDLKQLERVQQTLS